MVESNLVAGRQDLVPGRPLVLDDAMLERFKAESQRTGKGSQTPINEALGQHVSAAAPPVTASQVRKIVRDELEKAYDRRLRTVCRAKLHHIGQNQAVCTYARSDLKRRPRRSPSERG